jgi:hypothetical protein
MYGSRMTAAGHQADGGCKVGQYAWRGHNVGCEGASTCMPPTAKQLQCSRTLVCYQWFLKLCCQHHWPMPPWLPVHASHLHWLPLTPPPPHTHITHAAAPPLPHAAMPDLMSTVRSQLDIDEGRGEEVGRLLAAVEGRLGAPGQLPGAGGGTQAGAAGQLAGTWLAKPCARVGASTD